MRSAGQIFTVNRSRFCSVEKQLTIKLKKMGLEPAQISFIRSNTAHCYGKIAILYLIYVVRLYVSNAGQYIVKRWRK